MVFNGRMLKTQAKKNKFVTVHVIVLVKGVVFINIIFFVDTAAKSAGLSVR